MTIFAKPLDLSNGLGSAEQIRSAASGTNFYVIWSQTPNWGTKNPRILFAASHDSGKTFGPVLNVSDPILSSDRPGIVTQDNLIFLVYVELHTLPTLFFRLSKDFGATFSAPIPLGNPAPGDSWVSNVQLAAADKNVYVVWAPLFDATALQLSASHDSGATFSPPVKLTWLPGQVFEPKIAAYKDHVFVAFLGLWQGTDLYTTWSHDFGKSFSQPAQISTDGHSHRPQLTAQEERVYLTWESNHLKSPWDVMFVMCPEMENPGKPINLTNNDLKTASVFPQVAASGTRVYVAWYTGGNPGIGLVQPGVVYAVTGKPVAKQKFGAPVKISADKVNNTLAWMPRLAADGESVYLSWTSDSQNGDRLNFTSGNLDLANFQPPVDLGDVDKWTQDTGLLPITVTTGMLVYVTWAAETFGGTDATSATGH